MSEKFKKALRIAVNVGCGFEGDAEDAAELLTLIVGLESRIAELEGLVDELIEIGDRLVFPDGVFDDEQSVIERDWRILTKAIKECEE